MARVRRRLLIASLTCVFGCAQQPARVFIGPHLDRLSYDALLAATPLGAGENIRVRELERGANSSVSLVQIRDREQPHIHTRYDLTVLLAKGSGTLWLNGNAFPMHEGDTVFIAKGTPHYFVNGGPEPAAALAVFAPAFTEPDQQSVP
jgi:quercetin dioxygenase-like cupin family protein